jgi:hypothetical protein
MTVQTRSHVQTRLSDFSEYRTKDDVQLTELSTIKASQTAHTLIITPSWNERRAWQ